MQSELKAIRGAISVDVDEKQRIIDAARELTEMMITVNGLEIDQIVSAIYTATADLVAEFPAVGGRMAGLTNTPLLCAQEIPVPGSQPRCIRVLMHAYVAQGTVVRPVYLKDAVSLRPDWIDADEAVDATANVTGKVKAGDEPRDGGR